MLLLGGWARLILAALTGRRRKCSRCQHSLSVHASAQALRAGVAVV